MTKKLATSIAIALSAITCTAHATSTPKAPQSKVQQEYVIADSIANYVDQLVRRNINENTNEQLKLEAEHALAIANQTNQELSEMYASAMVDSEERARVIEKLRAKIEKQLKNGLVTQRYFFATGEHKLNELQTKELAVALQSIAQLDDVNLKLIGRADPRGNKAYNHQLVEKRINTVHQMAILAGINEGQLFKENLGEVGGVQTNNDDYFFQRYLTIEVSKKNQKPNVQ